MQAETFDGQSRNKLRSNVEGLPLKEDGNGGRNSFDNRQQVQSQMGKNNKYLANSSLKSSNLANRLHT